MTAPRRRLDVTEVKAAIPPVDFFRAELPTMPPPKGKDWQDGGLCPFHNDRRAGSFRINLDTGAFLCFACGIKGGDIISFIQRRDGLTFRESLRLLADEWEV